MEQVIFRVHAIQRMFQRGITIEDVRLILKHGEVIKDYNDDTPYPSKLILHWIDGRPIHVVAAYNMEHNEVIVITAYEPDPEIWSSDFRRRVL